MNPGCIRNQASGGRVPIQDTVIPDARAPSMLWTAEQRAAGPGSALALRTREESAARHLDIFSLTCTGGGRVVALEDDVLSFDHLCNMNPECNRRGRPLLLHPGHHALREF